jgi:hypothetical protein
MLIKWLSKLSDRAADETHPAIRGRAPDSGGKRVSPSIRRKKARGRGTDPLDRWLAKRYFYHSLFV